MFKFEYVCCIIHVFKHAHNTCTQTLNNRTTTILQLCVAASTDGTSQNSITSLLIFGKQYIQTHTVNENISLPL